MIDQLASLGLAGIGLYVILIASLVGLAVALFSGGALVDAFRNRPPVMVCGCGQRNKFPALVRPGQRVQCGKCGATL